MEEPTVSPKIDAPKPERVVHRALRNIMLGEWGLTKESITQAAIDIVKVDIDRIVTRWLNGEHMRDFVSNVARKVIRDMAEPMLRNQIAKFITENIKITVDKA